MRTLNLPDPDLGNVRIRSYWLLYSLLNSFISTQQRKQDHKPQTITQRTKHITTAISATLPLLLRLMLLLYKPAYFYNMHNTNNTQTHIVRLKRIVDCSYCSLLVYSLLHTHSYAYTCLETACLFYWNLFRFKHTQIHTHTYTYIHIYIYIYIYTRNAQTWLVWSICAITVVIINHWSIDDFSTTTCPRFSRVLGFLYQT